MNSFGLSAEEIRKINSVFSRYPQIAKAIIYGSRAKGNFKPASDIDLALEGEGVSLTILQRIEYEIEELNLPYKFDLALIQKVESEDLLDHIRRIGKLFYARVP